MKKIVIFSVIIVLFLLTLLYSCKPSSKIKNTPTKPPLAQKINLKGREINILYRQVNSGAMNNDGKIMADRIKRIETELNCRLIDQGSGNITQEMDKLHTSIQKGIPYADLAFVPSRYIPQVVEKEGLYMVLNDFSNELDLYNTEIWDQNATSNLLTIAELILGAAPIKRGSELINSSSVMFFNKSLLERENLWSEYNLYDMQREKKWTWDALEEIALKTVKDTDSDGRIDRYGLVFDNSDITVLYASNSGGGSTAGRYGLTSENEPKCLLRDKDHLNVLNFLYSNGAKGKNWMTAEYYREGINNPIDYFLSGNCAFIIEKGEEIEYFKGKKMHDTLGVAAVPIGPDNSTKKYYLDSYNCEAWVIPVGTEDPGMIAGLMKEFCAPLYSIEDSEKEIEGYLKDHIGNETEIVQTYKLLNDADAICYSMDYLLLGGLAWRPVNAVYTGSEQDLITGDYTPDMLIDSWEELNMPLINEQWDKVIAGAERIKKKRAEEGKS